MAKKKDYDDTKYLIGKILLILLFIVGIVFAYISFKMLYSIEDKDDVQDCLTSNVKRSIYGLIVLSVILATGSFSFLFFDCQANIDSIFFKIFEILIWSVSITILTLASMVFNSCKASRKFSGLMIIIQSVILLFTIIIRFVIFRGTKKRKTKFSDLNIKRNHRNNQGIQVGDEYIIIDDPHDYEFPVSS